MHSSPGDESSDDVSNRRIHHQNQRGRTSDDTETALASKPFNVLRPLADRHRVLLRVATATLNTTAAVNADNAGVNCREAAVETIPLVGGDQSTRLPSVTDDDVVAVVEKSPSDEYGAATGSDTGCPSSSPTPRRTCPSLTVPIVHSSAMAPTEADDDVFRAVSGATLTVDSCPVDGRPSFSSSADGQTDCTRISGSDESPLPELRPSANLTLTVDPDDHIRLAVPSPLILMPQARDRMPTRRSARVGINFQSLTSPRSAPKTTAAIKRSRRREKKVTKTLAIVLGKRTPFATCCCL